MNSFPIDELSRSAEFLLTWCMVTPPKENEKWKLEEGVIYPPLAQFAIRVVNQESEDGEVNSEQ